VSETPISDSTAHNVGDLGMLCRRLERELNAANLIIRQQQLLDEENLRLKDRIKRLVKVGDYLDAYVSLVRQNRTVKQLWHKAKEVKP
jgi:hypothetical protein